LHGYGNNLLQPKLRHCTFLMYELIFVAMVVVVIMLIRNTNKKLKDEHALSLVDSKNIGVRV